MDKARADQQAEYAKHQQQMKQEREHHEGLLGAMGREVEAAKKAAGDLLKRVEADAATVAQQKARLPEKLRLIEAA